MSLKTLSLRKDSILIGMAKVKKAFFCNSCGVESPKWFGRCTSCGEWSSCVEEVVSGSSGGGRSQFDQTQRSSRPIAIGDVVRGEFSRLSVGSVEVDRVLGGGLVSGSMVLLGGEPGIGKSTLALQLALRMPSFRVLYVSGEESAEQIKLRADRLGISNDQCMILCETELESILLQVDQQSPSIVIIDSIQTLHSQLIESSAGSVSQVRECSSLLLRKAKQSSIPILLIGHITKDGSIAGPKVLEHIVDVVFQFEGDSNTSYRILRSIKNRFGATNEIGVFDMQGDGLHEVSNPSEIFVTSHSEPLSGISIGIAMEGARPYMIETQALVSPTGYSVAQRSATGFDSRRMGMLVAVLEKRLGFKLGQKDIFLNLVGGFRTSDTGLDLAFVAAVISSALDIALGDAICFSGEIGLSGEVRPALRTTDRVVEASRLGYSRVVVSDHCRSGLSRVDLDGIEVIYVGKVLDLVQRLFGR